MTEAPSILRSLGGWIWETTWQASVLAVIIFAVQLVLGRRLTAQWRYGFWLLVVVRLFLPSLPESRASVYNLAPPTPSFTFNEPALLAAQPLPEKVVSPAIEKEISGSTPQTHSMVWSSLPWLPLIWLAGAGIFLVTGLGGYVAFWRRVRRLETPSSPLIDELFQRVKDRWGTRRARLLVTGAVDVPAVCGVLYPVILLPAKMEERLSEDELRLVLLHELTHVRRFDIFTAWLFWFFGALHWFNPVLQLAFWRARLDRELACDETVLAETPELHSYGSALLRLWQDHVTGPQPSGVIGIFEKRTEPFRRMNHISTYRRPSFLQTAAGFIALAALAICALTGQSSAQKVAEQDSRPLLELEYQLISVPNSSIGKILGLSQVSELYPTALDMLHRNEAELYDISKTVTPTGQRATVAAGGAKVEMEPTLSPDQQTMDVVVGLETIGWRNKGAKFMLTASLPVGSTLCIGSFDDPREGTEATIFVFAKWKIVEL